MQQHPDLGIWFMCAGGRQAQSKASKASCLIIGALLRKHQVLEEQEPIYKGHEVHKEMWRHGIPFLMY
ncbi:hypothetical protein COLO4_24424 [Corchorus olitorius]|uniref:Uncharacterized protein n=1 Tax=Corchorus olitorius TaxID=93759 RepID=A0A1R3IA48_9ROSI|nr:hypothetical protein COLO4_24424 [Corchorus olitorius]